MYTVRERCAGARLLGTILLSGLASFRSYGAEEEIDALVERACRNNPSILALEDRVAQALAAYDATEGFFDPQLQAGGGWSGDAFGVPFSGPDLAVPADATVLESGIVLPVKAGLYVDLGVAARYLSDPDGDFGDVYQTQAGGRLRVPLARDRGFALWRADRLAAFARWHEAGANLLEAVQQLHLQVERGYVGLLEADALVEVEEQSSARVRKLLDETLALVDAKVVPAYQVSAARLEWQLSREDVARAEQVANRRGVLFTSLLGGGPSPEITGTVTSLVARANRADVDATGPDLDRVESRRGAFRALDHQERAAEAERGRAREGERPDLSFELGARWQAEDEDGPIGSRGIITEEETAGEALLVWRRTLRNRASRAEIRRITQRLAELEQEREALRLQVVTEYRRAAADYARNRERLGLLHTAVEEGLRTLEAERERFRLGEGRSRNVLDAQKDVADATRREVLVASALLLAVADYRFATAYLGDEPTAIDDDDEYDPGDRP